VTLALRSRFRSDMDCPADECRPTPTGTSPAMTAEFSFVTVRQRLSQMSPTDLIRGSMPTTDTIEKDSALNRTVGGQARE